jgi:hypothetical protein
MGVGSGGYVRHIHRVRCRVETRHPMPKSSGDGCQVTVTKMDCHSDFSTNSYVENEKGGTPSGYEMKNWLEITQNGLKYSNLSPKFPTRFTCRKPNGWRVFPKTRKWAVNGCRVRVKPDTGAKILGYRVWVPLRVHNPGLDQEICGSRHVRSLCTTHCHIVKKKKRTSFVLDVPI